MVFKYKKLYQVSTDAISETCREWIGFTYKGDGTFTINYTLCGETEPRELIINLPGDGGNDVYYDLTHDSPFDESGVPCVVYGSVIKITPVPNIFTPAYGNPCP